MQRDTIPNQKNPGRQVVYVINASTIKLNNVVIQTQKVDALQSGNESVIGEIERRYERKYIINKCKWQLHKPRKSVKLVLSLDK